jgi:hypothetical protein
MLLGMGASLAYGRRGTALLLFALLLCFMYIYFISNHIKPYKKISIVVLLIFGIVYFTQNNNKEILNNISLFEVFVERLEMDTRGHVEKEMIHDFGSHLGDWIFGRGIAGKYYTSAFGGLRSAMETAYYRMILHGGILLLVFYLVVALRAFYLGFFKSNNILCKAMASYIGLVTFFIFTSLSPFEFSHRIIIFWLCIIFCYSRTWRMKTDQNIQQNFANNH